VIEEGNVIVVRYFIDENALLSIVVTVLCGENAILVNPVL
jgi:hypothetical protein